MKYSNIKKSKLKNTSRIPYIHHIILFIFREILFFLILPLILFPAIETNSGFYVESDVVFLNAFNMFILFLTCNSVISQKIFRYYAAILALLDHGIINILILKKSFIVVQANHAHLIAYLISISFILEALISIYLVYINRFLSWMDTFKKLGANTKMQNAYFWRQVIHALYPYEFFVAFEQAGSVMFPLTGILDLLVALNGVVMVISFFQVVFTCANIYDEDVLQRRLAIFFTFLRIANIATQIGVVIHNRGIFKQGQLFITMIFAVNYLGVAIIVLLVLIRDMMLFGSGLKEHLKSKPQPIGLS